MLEEHKEDLFEEAAPAENSAASHLFDATDPLHEDRRDLVEALIFASPDPLDTARIAEKLGWEADQILACIEALNQDYEDQGRSFELVRLAGGWQMITRRRYGGLLSTLLKEMVRPRLSRAALETLAVIAYRQPVTKSDVEQVRGVKADGVVRTLLERDLIQVTGRSDSVGRPLLYRTTRAFLEAFGLDDLKALPRRKEVDEWLKGLREADQESLPPDALAERRPEKAAGEAGQEAATGSEDHPGEESLSTGNTPELNDADMTQNNPSDLGEDSAGEETING
jgi:segregation and condensation protein B